MGSMLLDLLAGAASLVMLLIRGVLLLVGPFLLYRWWTAHQVERRCAAWSTAPGTVLSATLDERTFVGMRRHRYQGYRAAIEYEYRIEGRTFRSTRVTTYDALVGRSSSYARHRPEAEEVLRRYPAGTPVQVHYDPERPHDAILQPGPSRDAQTLLYVGLAFTGVGLVVLT